MGSELHPSSCPHITANKASLLSSYSIVAGILVWPYDKKTLHHKVKLRKCADCDSSKASLSLHACLQCAYVGCFRLRHIHDHASKSGHSVACSTSTATLYCFQCSDHMYDREFDKAAEFFKNTSFECREIVPSRLYFEPNQASVSVINSGAVMCRMAADYPVGLRGLINLGNTCFMNCIIQCMTHTPLLRDYFLSDLHQCDKDGCLMCEMKMIFTQFYMDLTDPFGPSQLLHLVWTNARHLAGYEQQDAHEFFMATLDLLHRHSSHQRPQPHSGSCECIIDKMFTGWLQSDVVCQACRGISTTIEQFWDISLDLGHGAMTGLPTSLADCLDSFTRPEHLGSSAKIRCSGCQSLQESTKQLTIKKLPVVISFHLKRFEHSSRNHKKITTRITFPLYLDMGPYKTAKTAEAVEQGVRDLSAKCLNRYHLFAVVNHEGTIETGHYTAYVRQHSDRWFRCDDHDIKRATVNEVLSSEAYLLFYHKEILEYNTTNPIEAVRKRLRSMPMANLQRYRDKILKRSSNT